MKNVFISGVSGFIGLRLARRLAGQNYRVSGIGRRPVKIPNVAYNVCDIQNRDALRRFSPNAEIFIHLASLNVHADIARDPFGFLEESWIGTKNMLDAFIASGGKHFIFASTGKVYGDVRKLPLSEETPPHPKNAYGKVKYLLEQLIDLYATYHPDRMFSILRLFNVYGEGQNSQFLIPTIISRLKTSSKRIKLGDLEARRDFIYISDVLEAFICILKRPSDERFAVYNVGSGTAYSARAIVETIGIITGHPIRVTGDQTKKRADETDIEFCSHKKIEGLGWRARVDLKDGLERTLSFYNLLPPQCKQSS